MASGVPQLGGLDYDFVKEPPDSLKCLICMLVVNDPWQHGDCGRVYCKVCLDGFRKIRDVCPNCRTKKPVMFKDGRSEKDVRGLVIRCNNKSAHDDEDNKDGEVDKLDGENGHEMCPWTGELGDLQDHYKICPLQRVSCPNRCMESGEEVLVVRRDLENHLSTECLNRSYICPHCRESGTYLELATVHLEKCSKFPIPCSNKPCPAQIPRDDLKQHISDECPYTILSCQHSDIGCTVRCQRKDLRPHEMNLDTHMRAARTKIESMEKEMAGLMETITKELEKRKDLEATMAKEKINKRGRPITFKMSNYASRMADKKILKGGSFYTSPRGYKMCVIIEPNLTSKGLYVAIYAHIVKGEYDHLLMWPLTGTVTFELLNQLGNHTHKKESSTFLTGNKDSHRVTEEGRGVSEVGCGCPKFISCNKLAESSRDVQYLKDDTLYWRVTVEVPDHVDQHWLRCN